MSRQLGLLLLVGLAGCAAPVAHDDEPVANASSTLSVAAGGGLAFVRLDGFMATGDVSTGGYVNLWAGTSGLSGSRVLALQGPRMTGAKAGWGSFLTRELHGSTWKMRGTLVDPSGALAEMSTTEPPLETVQDATHVTAIPDTGLYTGGREVFFYSSATRTGAIWNYGYNDATRRFTASPYPSVSWTGFGLWHQIVGYPKGVLFFQKDGLSVWRGRWNLTAGWPFEFAPLPPPPRPNPVKPNYTDVTYVEGGCATASGTHFFYDRASGKSTRVRYGTNDTIEWSGTENDVGPGWDKVIGTGNGKVFLFRSDGTGTVLNLCDGTYTLQSGFTADWTSITRVE